ncbi:serine/threonine-protein kinase [Stieleria sp. ICT_E10.1]|uniref:serine/threonine-protein kinase n=1 Tax=Stieleria sedimenti TaxID=2976331 RepID=UPI00217F77B5|nr:serine/threonine-protein kinase [Stieleria sedimenti]MCS7468221.1 serine/threonine-protein kinase [Stieleria sedimenti]
MPKDLDAIETLLAMAVELDDDAERTRFIDQHCDESIRVEVRQMVADYFSAGDLLDSPVVGDFGAALDPPDAPAQIGPYRLREKIAEGGMGVVFVADQNTPVNRRVALKLIRPGLDSKQVISRFDAERQTLALMDHPNIATIFDAGATEDGRPFFVMEFVQGLPITEFCEQQSLDHRQRLELFLKVCAAIEHAHQKGIIHRDLKPNNLLVTLHDDVAEPKVIDFGLAKATMQPINDATVYTRFGQVIGTPMYMSPEQLQWNNQDVDTRSDVYSLGVIFYELLTGTTPFDKQSLGRASLDELRRIICESEPPRPSQRLSTLADRGGQSANDRQTLHSLMLHQSNCGELDWITLKAMEKDRTRRYPSARDFAADVRRFLDNEPVEACPPTRAYRLRKFATKHRSLLTTLGLVLATLVIGTVLAGWQAVVAHREADRANLAQRNAEVQAAIARSMADKAEQAVQQARESQGRESQQRQIAERALYVSDTRLAASQIIAGERARALTTLLNHVPLAKAEDRRSWEWFYLLDRSKQSRLSWNASNSNIRSIDWSSDGEQIATASEDRSTAIWDASDGSLVKRFRAGVRTTCSVAWHPIGSTLAWGSTFDESLIRIWDQATDQIMELHDDTSSIWTIRWNHDGSAMVVGAIPFADREKSKKMGHNLVIWRQVDGKWAVTARGFFETNLRSTEWNFDDSLISVAGEYSQSWLVDAHTLQVVSTFPSQGRASAWHPTRNRLARGLESGECVVINTDNSEEVARFHADGSGVTCLCWSPDANHLASCGSEGIAIWNTSDWSRVAVYSGFSGSVNAMAWHPNSQRLASTGTDGAVHVWPLSPHENQYDLDSESDFAWTDDGLIRTLSDPFTVVDRNGRTGDIKRSTPLPSADRPWKLRGRNLIAANAWDGKQLKFNAATINASHQVDREQYDIPSIAPEGPSGLRWTANRHGNKLAVVAIRGGRPAIHDLTDRSVTELDSHAQPFSRVLFWSPDETMIGLIGHGRYDTGVNLWHLWLHLYDANAGCHLASLDLGPAVQGAGRFAWSPDSSRMVAAGRDGQCQIIEMPKPSDRQSDDREFRVLLRKRMHQSAVTSLSWHPDGTRIASVASNSVVKIWDVNTGDVLLTLPVEGKISQMEWSPDGNQLATRNEQGKIRIWDARDGYAFASSRFFQTRLDRRVADDFEAALEAGDFVTARERLGTLLSREGTWGVLSHYHLGLLDLHAGDPAEYQEVCRRMLEKFSEQESPTDLHFAAWACALGPSAVQDYTTVIEMARQTQQAAPESLQFRCGVGAILFRAGHYRDALATLKPLVVVANEEKLTSTAYVRYFLAMTLDHLGNRSGAIEQLSLANGEAEAELESNPAWNRRLTLQLLRKECEATVGLSLSSTQRRVSGEK